MPAYNQYFPQNYSYSPYYPQYQPTYQPPVMQQPVQQPVQQAQQAASQPTYYTGRIWVNSNEVEFYPVAPNNAVDLWDRNGKTLYQKKADATGKPSVTVYDVVERTQSVSNGVSEQGDKLPVYATKDDLGAVVGAVRGLDEALVNIKSDIDTIKGDMYGIAGKKKGKKAVEAAEDDE